MTEGDSPRWSSSDLLLLFGASAVAIVLLQVLTARWIVRPRNPAEAQQQKQQRQQQQQRGDLHLQRRVQHAATGLVFVSLSYVIPPKPASAMLLTASGALFALHRYRLRSNSAQEFYLKLFGSLLRPHEKHNLPGAFYFLLGTALSCLTFPLRVARLSVLILSLSDPAAALVGTTLGGPKFDEHASVGGCAACLIVSLGLGLGVGFPWDEATVAAVSATVAEALAPRAKVDDNLLVPVVTGAVVGLYNS